MIVLILAAIPIGAVLLLVQEILEFDSVILVWAGIIGGTVFLSATVLLIGRRLVRWYKKRQTYL